MTALDPSPPRHPAGRWRASIAARPDYARLVLGVALAGVAAASVAITVLSASLPTIAEDLDTSYSTATWITVAPLLALAAFTPMAGKLGDLIGHRRTFIIGIGGFAIGSLATSAAWNIGSLIALRVATQAFGTLSAPAALALLMATFEPTDRARPLGYYSGVSGLTPALGVLIGGPAIDAVGWRLIFVAQGVLATGALVAAWLVLRETQRRRVRFDIAGATSLGIGVSGLVFAANRAAVWGLDHPAVLIAAALAPVGLVGFVLIEQRVAEPFFPLELLRRPAVAAALGSQALMQASFMGSVMVTPLLVQRFWGYGAGLISLVVLPRPLGFSAAASWAGRHHTRMGGRRLVMSGLALAAIGNIASTVGARATTLPFVLAGAALSGMGNGATRPSITTAVANSVGNADLGLASGALNMSAQIGSAVGISVMASIVESSNSPSTFAWTYGLATVTGLVAGVTALRIDWGHPG